jgi:hypothetical protein
MCCFTKRVVDMHERLFGAPEDAWIVLDLTRQDVGARRTLLSTDEVVI